jgi:N-acetylglucosamine kinase-like BadF-type ATPase
VVGVAGAGREAEREELRQALRGEALADRVIVTGDTELALTAAFGSSVGILLTAGTGSMAVARDPAGTIHRAGGLGWQMGDEGSGYSIGRAGLVAVGRASDGRGPATSLGGRIAAVVRAESIEGLVRWAATAGTAEVAALAQTVLQVAKEGDPVAGAIVTHAAEELCGLVSRLLGQFGPDTRHPVAAAMNGGLLLPGSMLRDAVMERLRRNPRLELREAPLEAALGAVELAAQAAG